MKILCRIFGHKFKNVSHEEWLKDNINFICSRCGKKVNKYKYTLYNYRKYKEVFMSNSILNFHLKDGEPQGSGATLSEISDYYGDLLFELKDFFTLYESKKLKKDAFMKRTSSWFGKDCPKLLAQWGEDAEMVKGHIYKSIEPKIKMCLNGHTCSSVSCPNRIKQRNEEYIITIEYIGYLFQDIKEISDLMDKQLEITKDYPKSLDTDSIKNIESFINSLNEMLSEHDYIFNELFHQMNEGEL